jgi:chemotaxis protein MotD
MTDAVKLAGNTAPLVQGGNGRSRDKSDEGGFEILFRLGARGGKANVPREGSTGKQSVAGWDLLARLEAAIRVKDGAIRVGDKEVRPEGSAESEKEERDPEDASIVPMAAAAPTADVKRTGDAATPKANARRDDADEGAAAVKPVAAGEDEAKPAKGDMPGARQQTEAKSAKADTGPAGTPAAVQPTTPKLEAKGGADFIAFVPAEKTTAAAGTTGPESGGASLRDRRGNGGGAASKVTVVAPQDVVAPGLTPATTSSLLVAGLAGDSGWQNSLRTVASMQQFGGQIGAAPLHTMRLQLHPAELGMVTANLRFAGDQLQVELQVENREAYDRLQNDSETIVKSLRALGYEIDQVTVQQPQIANNTMARAETNFSSLGNSARDAQAFGSQGQGGGERLGGQGAGRDERNAGGRDGGNAQAAQDSDRRGIYI